MLDKIVPLALVVALGFGAAASALTDTGIVASVDTVSDTVTLSDGNTFAFDDESYADRLSVFKPGDRVAISWHHVGSKLEASAISPVNAPDAGDLATGYPVHGVDHLD